MLKYLIVALGLLPAMAQAAGFPVLGAGRVSCESLWVERNQIANVAGYCFNSALGQAVFNNADCTPGDPALEETAVDRISRIKRAEEPLNCAVDTGRNSLIVNGRYGELRFGVRGLTLGRWPNALRELDVFPRIIGSERACMVSGLSDADDGFLALRSGPDVRYPQIGALFNGDQVSSKAACMGRWCFSDAIVRGNRRAPLNGWFHTNWCKPRG